jgi:MFS family permease
MAAPLYVIYHVKVLGLSNTQIAYFVVTSGILSALLLPVAKKLMERFGTMKVYGAVIVIMALAVLPYGFVHALWMLIAIQGLLGLCIAVSEVSSQSIMMEEADKHKKEMAYFSDFQLVMQCGAAAGAMLTGALVAVLPLWGCFIAVAGARLLFFGLVYVQGIAPFGKRNEADNPQLSVQADRS